MDDDWTDQLQEMLALQSICEDDFQYIGVEGAGADELIGQDVEALLASEPPPGSGLSLRCQALVRLELAEPVTVTVGLHASISVSYLPPLRIQLVLPPGYPSSRLPDVEVLTTWLPEETQNALEGHLREQGEAMIGAPVVFEWVQWLQENALDVLGAKDGQLSLPRPLNTEDSDQNGASSSSGLQGHHRADEEEWEGRMLMQLHTYNTMQEVEKFQGGMWQCGICFEEMPGLRCIRLPGCSHFYCLECMRQHAAVNVKDGQLGALVCPTPDCGKPLGPEVLKDLLSSDGFARWEELTLSRTLDCMTDVVYCPRCQAGTIEDQDHCAQCPECMYVFCGLCSDAWHPGSDCLDTDAKMEVLKKRSNGKGAGASSDEATLNAINELKSLKVMRDTSKRCPSCRMAIQKTSGCNKMICTNCDTRFCWKCEKEISGYDHFSAMTCTLFDQAEIDEWNAMMVSLCPQCRQANAKVNNNNHIGCWACGAHHCYLCRKILGGGAKDRSGGRHFSTKGCKQHTSD